MPRFVAVLEGGEISMTAAEVTGAIIDVKPSKIRPVNRSATTFVMSPVGFALERVAAKITVTQPRHTPAALRRVE